MKLFSKIILFIMCIAVSSCSTSMYVLGYNVWHEGTQIPHPYGDENIPSYPYYSPTANNLMHAETGFGSPVASVLTLPIGVVFGPIFLIAGNIAGVSEPKNEKEYKKKTPQELLELYEREMEDK